MNTKITPSFLSSLLLPALLLAQAPTVPRPVPADRKETHLTNVRQLTSGGTNAEAYFSPDGRMLTFQATPEGASCDQIFVMDVTGSGPRRVSTGKGRTTCSYFLTGGRTVIYSSTHEADPECPPRPDHSLGYVWPIYAGYEIYATELGSRDPSKPRNLTRKPGYDAEATVSPDGSSVVFTSTRDGDLDLYSMDPAGGHVKRLTHSVGYDGGAFYSPDGKKLVYRAFHPRTASELLTYKSLLKQGLFKPSWLEIFVANADGTGAHAITDLNAASFAPSWTPDGKRILFSSNPKSPRVFNLYIMDADGTHMEQITYSEGFDGFPLLSPDGKTLVFASKRQARGPHETNIFLADFTP